MTDRYEYAGKVPVQVGDKVELDPDQVGLFTPDTVDVTLAAQFIATGRFYLYADKGVTWRPVKESNE